MSIAGYFTKPGQELRSPKGEDSAGASILAAEKSIE
jgi:hypothetical protein